MLRQGSHTTEESLTKERLLAPFNDKIQSLEKDKTNLLQKNDLLQEQVNWFRQQMFGRSSEKTPAQEINVDQGKLFNEAELIVDQSPGHSEAVTIPEHKRKKKGRKRIPDNIPRVDIVHDLPEDKKVCDTDGKPLKRIGEITSEQLDFIPATLRVLRHIRYKYACSSCSETVRTASKPQTLLPKSLASPSLLAHITTAKYVDGLPLHRQEKQFSRLGLQLGRATMASWMIKIGGTHVQPLINLLNDECINSPLIHIDETPVQVLKSHKDPSSDHWIWVRANGSTKKRVVLFDYAASRGKAAPERLLDGFEGIIMTDGYAVYDNLAKTYSLTHAACMAHLRRYFHDAKKIAKHNHSHAQPALDYIAKLYRIERKMREQHPPPSDEEKLRIRAEQSKPIILEFKTWLDNMALKVPPKSALGKAVFYSLRQWRKVETFLSHAEIPLDNNRAENAIRPFVIARKNFLFCDTQAGATASANLFSLVESAKANELEPHAYLSKVYEKLPLATSVEDFEALLPWNISISG